MQNRLFVLASMLSAAVASGAMAQVMTASASPITSTAGTSAQREFVVNVTLSGFTGAVGAQTTFLYDPAVVEFVSAAAGDDFPTLIYSNHNSGSSKVTVATGVNVDNPTSGIASGNIAKLTFRTVASACADADAIIFSTGAIPSRVSDSNGTSLSFTESNSVSVTSLAPFSLAGVPSNVSVAADAGTVSGSLQTLTAPTASNSCGTALTVNASRSDSAAMNAYYPVGTTTITYSATDAAGNTDSAQVTVTVANHQLLDASLSLAGSITGSSSRSIRVKAGASTQLVNVSMTNGSGTASDVQVPVAASYSCVSAKDAGHSLTSSGAATVPSGTVQYSATLVLDQGDSNDDDLVDILDFGIYVGDFGAAVAGGISNFNDDLFVNSGDFGFISLNYARRGTACGAFTGGNPRLAVSVKQLRREGLGELAASDLNRDGMLDSNDIVWYLQRGIRPSRPDVPSTPW